MNTPDARLAALRQWLQRHADAARDGDADMLAACAAEVRREVTALGRAPVSTPDIPLLQALLQQCIRTQAILARRQQDVERSLAALRASAPQGALPLALYGAHGALAGGGGFGRA